jgi:hypothetical protein
MLPPIKFFESHCGTKVCKRHYPISIYVATSIFELYFLFASVKHNMHFI